MKQFSNRELSILKILLANQISESRKELANHEDNSDLPAIQKLVDEMIGLKETLDSFDNIPDIELPVEADFVSLDYFGPFNYLYEYTYLYEKECALDELNESEQEFRYEEIDELQRKFNNKRILTTHT